MGATEMTADMTNNRVPYGLLNDEEKAVLYEHEEAGGEFERRWPHGLGDAYWEVCAVVGGPAEYVYRTVPLPKTQDVIAWDRLPEWVEWVARDVDGWVWCYRLEPEACTGVWSSPTKMHPRIDDFPGIVQIGTCDWKDSKQRRPRG
jgi:hypothetical protein